MSKVLFVIAIAAAGCQSEVVPSSGSIVVNGESGPAEVGMYEAGVLHFDAPFLAPLREAGRTLSIRVGDDEHELADTALAVDLDPDASFELVVFSSTIEPTEELSLALGPPPRTDISALTCTWEYHFGGLHYGECSSCQPSIGNKGGKQHIWDYYRTSKNCFKTEVLSTWTFCEPCL